MLGPYFDGTFFIVICMRLLLAIFVSELEIGWNLILAVKFCSAQNTSLHLFETKKEVCLIPKHDIDDEQPQPSYIFQV